MKMKWVVLAVWGVFAVNSNLASADCDETFKSVEDAHPIFKKIALGDVAGVRLEIENDPAVVVRTFQYGGGDPICDSNFGIDLRVDATEYNDLILEYSKYRPSPERTNAEAISKVLKNSMEAGREAYVREVLAELFPFRLLKLDAEKLQTLSADQKVKGVGDGHSSEKPSSAQNSSVQTSKGR